MKYPAGLAYATVQELSDIVDALSVATEELRYRADELADDYTKADRVEMEEKADRLDGLFKRFVIALDGAARAQALVDQADALGRDRTMPTDTATLDAIYAAMDGEEWNPDLWDVISALVVATGRPPFKSPDDDV